jgi:tropomyosin
LEAEVERADKKINDLKSAKAEEESTSSTTEALQRKISILENELDTTEKNLKETTEK